MKQSDGMESQELPLSLFKLFPRRSEPEELTVERMAKLFEVVSCPFCLTLLQFPVFLRCGHRFCRQCLDNPKISEKKNCPVCLVETKSKLKYKEDPQIRNFIQGIFGSADDWRRYEAEIKKKELDRFKSISGSNLKKNLQAKKQYQIDVESVSMPLSANTVVKEEKDLKKKKSIGVIEPQPLFSTPIEEENLNRSSEYIATLKAKYGLELQLKIACDVGILFHIHLRKVEDDPLTRQLQKSGLQTLTKATVRNIVTYIARQLNLPDDTSFIRLYIRKDEPQNKNSGNALQPINYIELTQPLQTLGEINETYWPQIRNDFSIFTMNDLLTSIHEASRIKIPDKRVIYYKLFFEHLSL